MAYTSYDSIGEGYDNTRQADPYLTERIFELLGSPASGEFLDIGCGTGNYSVALAERGPRITGVDPSAKMLERAVRKSNRPTWVAGNVEELPFANQQFDGAMAILTTHHWSDLAQGFAEIARVLRPASPIVLFTSTPEQMQHYWLCHYFPKMMERSCAVMHSAKQYGAILHSAGFQVLQEVPYAVRPDLMDQFLYSSKQFPERYLDPTFRAGISAFNALCDPKESASGLAMLEADIRTGAWSDIQACYRHDLGDYLFIAARRT